MSLKADHFEGGRFDFNKQLNQKFFLSHSVHMGALEVPAQGNQIIKIPNATHEFGANVVDTTTCSSVACSPTRRGQRSAQVRLHRRAECQAADEQGARVLAGDGGSGLQGADSQAQLKLGNGQFYGVNYLQSVSDTLSLGGEGFWLGGQKSPVGFAAEVRRR